MAPWPLRQDIRDTIAPWLVCCVPCRSTTCRGIAWWAPAVRSSCLEKLHGNNDRDSSWKELSLPESTWRWSVLSTNSKRGKSTVDPRLLHYFDRSHQVSYFALPYKDASIQSSVRHRQKRAHLNCGSAGDDGSVLVVPIVSPVCRLRLRNLARQSVSYLHARSVFPGVVLRYSDIWDRVPNRKGLTMYRIDTWFSLKSRYLLVSASRENKLHSADFHRTYYLVAIRRKVSRSMVPGICALISHVDALRAAAVALVLSAPLWMATGRAGHAQVAAKPEQAKVMVHDADPDWEVVTVKPSDPNDEKQSIRMRGRHLVIQKQTVETMLMVAYGLQKNQIADAPKWVRSDNFDADGVPDVEGQLSRQQFQSMMRKLLAERFGLKMHIEQRMMPVFALRLSKD